MKNTRPAVLVALLTSAFVQVGCAPKPTIVGKWQGTMTQPGGAVNTTMEFTPDGKETISAQAPVAGTPMDIGVSGTYKVDGTNLTQTLTTMTMRGRTMPIPPTRPVPRRSHWTATT